MFNDSELKKVSGLLRIFSRKAPVFRPFVRLRSWEDFQKIPVSNKANVKAFVKGGFFDNAFNITATSGSTASRMIVAHSREAYQRHVGRLVKIYKELGIGKGMLCLNLCAYELNSAGRMMEDALKTAGCGVIPMGPISSAEQVMEAAQLIRELKPGILNAYTNQLYDLFSVVGRRHSMRCCLVCGEPLWPKYQRRMEQLGGIQIHDHYGAMEISGLAIALKSSDEYMKVAADGLLLEVLEDSGRPSPVGKGDLLVTDLDNTCMPFIRYRLGDCVELVRRKGQLFIKVLSRIQETLLINGVVASKQELVRCVSDHLGHPRFFFVIDKQPLQYYDRMIINIAESGTRGFKTLGRFVADALGLDHCIDVRRHTGAIPRTFNGKIKYFIDARTKTRSF